MNKVDTPRPGESFYDWEKMPEGLFRRRTYTRLEWEIEVSYEYSGDPTKLAEAVAFAHEGGSQ